MASRTSGQAAEVNGEPSCKQLLQSANESYETLLHSSAMPDAGSNGISPELHRHSLPVARAGEHSSFGKESGKNVASSRRRPANGVVENSTVVSVPLPTTASVLAAIGSSGLQVGTEGHGSAALASRASLGPHEYMHVTSDSIRQLQDIRGSLRHVLHSDLAGVEDLLLRKLALIRRQESSTDLVVKNGAEITTMVNSSLHSENELLRNTLDRERFRRKQYERQTETLQDRLGEEHQQFSSALEALKRKDSMIEQLDKTLAKVVEGWQIHEVERQRTVRDLEKTQQQLTREVTEQRDITAGLELELATAIDDLAKEHERATVISLEKSARVHSMEEELNSLSEKLESSRSMCHTLELERSEASESRDKAGQQLNALYASMSAERKIFQEREQELLAKIDEISGLQISVLENERKKAADLSRTVTDVESQLCSTIRTVETLTAQLKEAELDKERLTCEISTLKEKHKAQLKQQESDMKLQNADMILRQRQEWAERLNARETELSAAQRKLANELHERHARQTGELTSRHHSEMAELRMRYQAQCTELSNKIDRMEEEVHQLRYSKRRMEAQYKEIASRLQSMMTMHTTEALKILTAVPPQGPDALTGKLPASAGTPTDSDEIGNLGRTDKESAKSSESVSLGGHVRASATLAEHSVQPETSLLPLNETVDVDPNAQNNKAVGSDNSMKEERQSQDTALKQVAQTPSLYSQEHILPIELDAYGLTSFKYADAPALGRHHDSRYKQPHLVDVLARQEARYGHSYFTPTTEEFIAFLRETQNTTKEKINDSDS